MKEEFFQDAQMRLFVEGCVEGEDGAGAEGVVPGGGGRAVREIHRGGLAFGSAVEQAPQARAAPQPDFGPR